MMHCIDKVFQLFIYICPKSIEKNLCEDEHMEHFEVRYMLTMLVKCALNSK